MVNILKLQCTICLQSHSLNPTHESFLITHVPPHTVALTLNSFHSHPLMTPPVRSPFPGSALCIYSCLSPIFSLSFILRHTLWLHPPPTGDQCRWHNICNLQVQQSPHWPRIFCQVGGRVSWRYCRYCGLMRACRRRTHTGKTHLTSQGAYCWSSLVTH